MEAVLLLVAFIILIVIIIVIYEIHRSNKAKKELQEISWQVFDATVAALKLSEQSISLLKDIIKESDLQDPNTITKSPHIFESCLEAYYQNKNIELISTETFEQIRALRKILEFLPMSRDMAFTSTRQFNINDRCLISTNNNKGMCLITDILEQNWSITKLEGQEIKANSQISISLNRPGEAEYKFKTTVIKTENNNLILSHTNQLTRVQLRNWVRIEVNIPVEITQMENGKVGDILSGRIIDMSGGGVGLNIPEEIPNQSKLFLNFDLPGQGRIKDLPVKVVRVAGKIHSVAFDGDFYQIQEQIIQYIFEKQRQDSLEKE
jgi:c-di-GMP-binding flagellar brake protein YcgR